MLISYVVGLFLPLSGNQHATGAPIGFISLLVLMLTLVLPQTSKPHKGKKAQPVLELNLIEGIRAEPMESANGPPESAKAPIRSKAGAA